MAEQSVHKMERQSQQISTLIQTDVPAAVTTTDRSVPYPNQEARTDTEATNNAQGSLMSTTESDYQAVSERMPHEFGPNEVDLGDMDLSVFDSMFNLDIFSAFEVPEEWS